MTPIGESGKTPEQERSSLERRIAELTARMKALDHLRKPENIDEWAGLYEAREELQKSLDADTPDQGETLTPSAP